MASSATTTIVDPSHDSDSTSRFLQRIHDFLRICVASTDLSTIWCEFRVRNENVQDKQEPEFMYAQILKEILIRMPLTEEGKIEMIEYLRRRNRNNATDLMYVEAFNNGCTQEQAIHWYTCDKFLYFSINQALRNQDINFLLPTQYYIRQLHEQLTKLHEEQKHSFANPLKVYRGLLIPNANFESIRSKKPGDFLSINSFLSTTVDVDIAMHFATSDHEKTDMTRILFDIEVDVASCQTAFANIENKSLLSSEKEILFTMGTIFTIQSIVKKTDDVWNILLKLTGKEDEQLLTLRKHFELDIFHLTPMFQLARLMLQTGQYDEAIRFYNRLLRDNDPLIFDSYQDRAAIYTNLAACYLAKEQKSKAEDLLNQSVQILQDEGSADDSDLPPPYNLLAMIYKGQGDAAADGGEKEKLYDKALSQLKEAERIGKSLTNNVMHLRRLASTFSNIGFIYDDQKKFRDALEMYKECLTIRLHTLPQNHPDLAAIYNNIAQVYQSLWDSYRETADFSQQAEHRKITMEHFNQAIEYFNKAHKIKRTSLPSYHPDLALSYNNIAMAYYLSGQLERALEEMEKALAIYSNSQNQTTYAEKVTTLQQWLVKVKEQQRGINSSK